MTVKSLSSFLIVCSVSIISSFNCYAETSTSMDLINQAKQHNDKTVHYKGEVIGDIMVRGDHAWLHVNDGAMAIGIWAPKTMIQNIRYAGDYHIKGDIVEVSGTFHRSCLSHGGDLDIHASEIRKTAPGSPVIQPVSRKKVCAGACSLMLVLLFLSWTMILKPNSTRSFTA
jgi:hypothetical protein